MIKKFEQFNPLDPYNEETWEDEKHIYEVGLVSSFFDAVGYVVASDNKEAIEKAFELELFNGHVRSYARTRKLDDRDVFIINDRLNEKLNLIKKLISTLENSINQMNEIKKQ